jgi:hypothetical protein
MRTATAGPASGPALKALGLINMPECYSPPERVYDQAMARGMDLVTITDHDTIKGAMELVDRGFDRFIVGQEVSVKFPEDRCLLHVLVWGLTPELDEEINQLKLRDDVYAVRRVAQGPNDLPHAVRPPALHPERQAGALAHRARRAALQGHRVPQRRARLHRSDDSIVRFINDLTPARIDALASGPRPGARLAPPWEKARTGGSDDHALLNIGRTWTQVAGPDGKKIRDPREFFRRVMNGESTSGRGGGALGPARAPARDGGGALLRRQAPRAPDADGQVLSAQASSASRA